MATHLLHFRPKHRHLLRHTTTTFHFSSSSSDNNQTRPSFLSDTKSSLKQPQSQSQQPHRPSFINSNPNPNTKKVVSLEEIRENLSKFRRRSSVTPPPPPSSPTSFQEMYQRNVMPKSSSSASSAKSVVSDETITEFFRMCNYGKLGKTFSLTELNELLKKLRETDEKEAESNANGFKYSQLRESLIKLQNDEKTKKSAGGVKDYLLRKTR